jgi:hypothetical protein
MVKLSDVQAILSAKTPDLTNYLTTKDAIEYLNKGRRGRWIEKNMRWHKSGRPPVVRIARFRKVVRTILHKQHLYWHREDLDKVIEDRRKRMVEKRRAADRQRWKRKKVPSPPGPRRRRMKTRGGTESISPRHQRRREQLRRAQLKRRLKKQLLEAASSA